MDGVEFLSIVTGSLILLSFFHPVLAIFFAIVALVAGCIYVANK